MEYVESGAYPEGGDSQFLGEDSGHHAYYTERDNKIDNRRKIYRDYDHKKYQNDLNAVMKKVVDIQLHENPHQHLYNKRHQQVAADSFKDHKNFHLKEAHTKRNETNDLGPNIFMQNLDREKQEREFKKREYIQGLKKQVWVLFNRSFMTEKSKNRRVI